VNFFGLAEAGHFIDPFQQVLVARCASGHKRFLCIWRQ
jgi:hypothetical protein